MNFLSNIIKLSLLLWALFFQRSLLLIYMGILLIYYLLSLAYYNAKDNRNFSRKVKFAQYSDRIDPTWRMRVDIDMTNAEKFLKEYNKDKKEFRMTYTHIALKAFGRGLMAGENRMGRLAFGNFIPSTNPRLVCPVNIKGKNIFAVRVDRPDTNSLEEIHEKTKIFKQIKEGKHKDANEQEKALNITASVLRMIFIISIRRIIVDIS